MVFETLNTYIDYIEEMDLIDIAHIYSSNKRFLEVHIDKDCVDMEWVINEIQEMKQVGFKSCKIVSKEKNQIIGFLDYKVDKESYLSLIMIHSDFKCSGFGKEVYNGLEKYMKEKYSSSIRIDVVTGYNEKVENFWKGQGFKALDEVKLNWGNKELQAVAMKKAL